MRQIVWSVFAMLLFAGTGWAGERVDKKNQPAARLGLVVIGEMDEALSSRLAQWVQAQTGLAVDLLKPREVDEAGLEACAKQVKELVDKKHPLVVGLLAASNIGAKHGLLKYEDGVAVVNAALLVPEDGDAERYGRRLERLVLGSYGFLLGMTYCPDPHCVMHPYKTLEQLDKMGRNFCPPNRQTFVEKASKKGLKAVDAGH